MKRILFILFVISMTSCDHLKKKYDCICDNTLSSAYITQRNGDVVKYTNGKDTLLFFAKVKISHDYSVKQSDCEKCMPCNENDRCISYTILSNDSVDIVFLVSYASFEKFHIITCAYWNNSSNEIGLCHNTFNDLDDFDIKTLCMYKKDEITSTSSAWYLLLSSFFEENNKWYHISCINNEIESAVQTMIVTEGKGITRIEFECGDIWTLIE